MTIEALNKNNKKLSQKPIEDCEPDELSYDINFDKMKVECICPKCGSRHVMNFHWIGRGTPRKFCQPCKSSRE
jgi:hypothetical protein